MPPPPSARRPVPAQEGTSLVSVSDHNVTSSLPSTSSIDSTTPTRTSSESTYSSASPHLVEFTLHVTTTLHITRFTTVTLLSRTSESLTTHDISASTTSSTGPPTILNPIPAASSVPQSVPAIPTFIAPPTPISSSSPSTSSSSTNTIWDLPTSDTFTAYLMLQTYTSAGSTSGAPPSTSSALNAEVLAGMIMGIIAVFVALCSLVVVLSQRRPQQFRRARGAVSSAFSRRRSVDSDVRPLRRLSSPAPFTLQLSGATPVSVKLGTTTVQEAELEYETREPGRSLRTSAATGTSETVYMISQPTGSTLAEPPTPPPPLPDRAELDGGRTRRTSRPPRKRGK
ncbi:hypothetical protein K466DRAFT_664286 [Polyporus arcularius HHB13444]|uniref:Uncharacterized protein n=1 Tax=Polyporus arcularius HHB13444 TaxID=1314778 RepID=A0A5C3PAV8_9APHY|nr:hypothetical protein K466DRAFT_664286 [Polyporus arcularius HHB13444]